MPGALPLPLDLTLAVVGKRAIDPRRRAAMERDLVLAFDALAEGLSSRPGASGMTLITGLADGADQVAGALFLAGGSGEVTRVLGAILPCPADEFARNSPIKDQAAFERAARSCAFITVLDGRLPPWHAGPDNEALRRTRRARADAFAAQADALLREADILVAVDDPEDEGEVGGTRHTLGRALDRRMPVILIQLGRCGVSLLGRGGDLDEHALEGECARLALVALARSITPRGPGRAER